MAHHLEHSGYNRLTERLNRFPQGAPPSNLLAKILQMLMSDREAELVSLLPIKPFTAKQAGKAWSLSEKETKKTLDTLAGRAVLVDIKVKPNMFFHPLWPVSLSFLLCGFGRILIRKY